MTSFRRRTGLALLAFLVLLAGVRAVLPALIRAGLESRLGDLVAGRIEVGDVDLELFRLAAALDDVRVLPETGEEAAIAIGRLYARVRPVPLVDGKLHLAEIRVASPEVRLERLPDGSFSLEALLPPAPEAGPEATSDEAPGPPPILLDRFVLEGGSLRFRDRATPEATPPLDVELSRVAIERLSLDPGAYDAPAELRVEARVDGAPVTLSATAQPGARGWSLAAELEAKGVPVRRARAYLPDRGWRELEGRLDATFSWTFDPGERNVARGDLALRDLAVRGSTGGAPALSWRALTVTVEEADLGTEALRLGEVRLTGAKLLVDPKADSPLPLLAEPAGEVAPAPTPVALAAAAEAPAASPEREAGTVRPPATSGDDGGWSVTLATLVVEEATLLLPGERSPQIALAATVRDVSPKTDGWPLGATARLGEGAVEVEGTVHATAPHLRGTISWQALDLPSLLAVAAVDTPVPVAAGTLRGALRLAPGDRKTTVVSGELGLAGFRTHASGTEGSDPAPSEVEEEAASDAEPDFSASLPTLEVGMEAVTLDAAYTPLAFELGRIVLESPAIRLTRDESGIVLPEPGLRTQGTDGGTAAAPAGSAPGDGASESEGALESERASPAEDAPRTGDEPVAGPAAGPTVSLGLLEIRNGRTVFVDRSIRPYFREELRDVSLRLERLRWPRPGIAALEVKALLGRNGRIVLTGEPAEGGALGLRFEGERIALPPLNPYVQSLSGYAILDGELSTKSRVDLGDRRYRARNALTFHDLELGGGRGESLFRSQFGISLSLGLALLRDVSGDINLDVPVSGERGSTEVDVASVTGSALRRAIVNALASPLKLLGAVTLGGGKVEAVAPEPIPFLSGGDRLRKGAADRFQELASLLAGRPALALELHGAVDALDVRRVKEAELLEELRADGGDGDASGDAAGPQGKIREYLEARAAGRAAMLGEAEATMLETLLAGRDTPTDRLAEIAAARAARASERLVEKHGIDSGRLRVLDPAIDPAAGPRGVVVGLTVRD